jgi:hypothetical protein
MKVKDLITILQKHGQNAELLVYDDQRDEGRPSLSLLRVDCDSYDGNQEVFLVVGPE